MKIHEEHLNHGAALYQIANHRKFTAINALKVKGKVSRSAFRINDSTNVYLKYATSPAGVFTEYQFTFNCQHREELQAIDNLEEALYLALICIEDREICCIDYSQFEELFQARTVAAGVVKTQFVILVNLRKGKNFRVYVNPPNTKGKMLKFLKIPRNRFPEIVVK